MTPPSPPVFFICVAVMNRASAAGVIVIYLPDLLYAKAASSASSHADMTSRGSRSGLGGKKAAALLPARRRAHCFTTLYFVVGCFFPLLSIAVVYLLDPSRCMSGDHVCQRLFFFLFILQCGWSRSSHQNCHHLHHRSISGASWCSSGRKEQGSSLLSSHQSLISFVSLNYAVR